MAKVEMDPAKVVCDMLVWYGVFKCVITPVTAIFAGELYGPGAFVGGAIVVATVMFGEMYFRDDE